MDFHITFQEASEKKLILSYHSERALSAILFEKARKGYTFK